jgi:hypothetical protein
MSGHQSFQGLIKDFSPERIERIDQKKQVLAKLELNELLKAAAPSWEIDPLSAPIDRIEACLGYLRQVVNDMGGELSITAKFPNNVEVSINSLPNAD